MRLVQGLQREFMLGRLSGWATPLPGCGSVAGLIPETVADGGRRLLSKAAADNVVSLSQIRPWHGRNVAEGGAVG